MYIYGQKRSGVSNGMEMA